MAAPSTLLPTRERIARTHVRPVRVLHVLPTLAGGGMELATVRLIRGIAGANTDDLASTSNHVPASIHGLCVLKAAEPELVAQCQSQARIWVFGDHPDLPSRLGCWWRLRQVIRQFRPDIVHARSTGVWVDAALATRGLHTVKLLLSFHGKTHLARPGFKRRLLSRWSAARADAVLAVADEASDYVQQEYAIPADKLTVIRNGVNVTRFHPAATDEDITRPRAELGLDPSARLVVCTASLVPIKGIDVLLRAWPTILAEWPSSRLLLLGEGPLQAHLQNLTWNLGCRQSVLFAGCRENVADLLRACDLFVLPSHYEACSNAILEALASGLPVVACATGGNRELIAHGTTGWLVPPNSPQALADCLLQALSDRDALRQVGQAARNQAITVHNESAWLAAYDTLYTTLAATQRQRPEADPCAE